MTHDKVRELRDRVDLLETVLAEAYQLAGAVGAPVRALDNLSAAIDGRTLPHDTFLPIQAEECGEVATLLQMLRGGTPSTGLPKKVVSTRRRNTLAAVLGRAGGQKHSRAKAIAARVNGAKGGRPAKRGKAS